MCYRHPDFADYSWWEKSAGITRVRLVGPRVKVELPGVSWAWGEVIFAFRKEPPKLLVRSYTNTPFTQDACFHAPTSWLHAFGATNGQTKSLVLRLLRP